MLLDPLLNEYRRHAMARFAIWVIAYGAALRIVDRTTGGVPGFLWFLFWITVIPTVFYYLARLVKFLRNKLLWRLRWRLVVTYVFIAVVPVVLLIFLFAIGGYIINGQFASYLVGSRFRAKADALRHLDRVIIHQGEVVQPKTPEALLDSTEKFFLADLREHLSSYPGLTMTLRLGSLERVTSLDGKGTPKPVSMPAWLKEDEFAGIVSDQGEVALRAVDRAHTSLGDLVVILDQPFTPDLLDQVGEGIGPIALMGPRERSPEDRPRTSDARSAPASKTSEPPRLVVNSEKGDVTEEMLVQSKTVQLPVPVSRLDYTIYNFATLEPTAWGGDQQKPDPGAGFFLVTTRLYTLDRQLISTLGQFSGIYWIVFAAVGIFFLVIEIVALIIGIQLTRTMTKTVDRLHEGTKRVQVGDFSYRIKLPAKDQLSALGEAFDGMTSSVERLLRESREKSRLEGELEIAREVQSQLFPQTVPEVGGLRLFGICKPARMVSGDYYDFLQLGEGRVGVVLGDISGKGISAALLMASIQSALHAQFYDGHGNTDLTESQLLSSSEVVERLNRQLFASTQTEKYATFFYAIYDEKTRSLTYTNAGHPAPFYFHRGKIERLNAGGTVVGLFGVANYEQAVIHLEPGDMLLAFTDGMTEPENSFGEEFGEERLMEAAVRASGCPPDQLVQEIYRAVSDWTGSPELQDDMTLVIARAVE